MYVLAFRGHLLPAWFAVVERAHTITPKGDGQSCEVTSWESIGGLGSFILKYFLSAPQEIRDANTKMAHDLTSHAENRPI